MRLVGWVRERAGGGLDVGEAKATEGKRMEDERVRRKNGSSIFFIKEGAKQVSEENDWICTLKDALVRSCNADAMINESMCGAITERRPFNSGCVGENGLTLGKGIQWTLMVLWWFHHLTAHMPYL